ncbi:galactose-binding domain-containing protein [Actinokineospora diospyrosa]|uniref:F5/8 type C domain n=1 Tax=Actinokineospora diospyrosa TaxID=103728 RepID=A0ABT1IBG6_9PSEU|nr:hypothetical protein [Actinokineospora diospyrosa]MCP2269969.1 F5/8 type C domain [Actinokineospora diospyrosa]
MHFPAKKHIPAALGLAAVALLAAIAPSATATPEGTAAVQLTAPPTTSSWPTPPCGVTTTTTPATTTPTTITYTGAPSTPGPAAAPLTTYPPSSPTFPAPTPRPGVNFALEGWALASSVYPGYVTDRVKDNDLSTAIGCAHSWTNDSGRSLTSTPEWIQVRWALPQLVSRVVVYTSDGLQLRDFDIQVLSPNEQWWDTVATVNYNTQSKVTAWFPNRATRGVKILAKVGPSHQPNNARVNEIQAFLY